MPIQPEIDYQHVLGELSVNREDPCEIIRELVSNSYDAGASRISYYPLLQYRGFVFFDNGSGLDQENEVNGITPYAAFFSIGRSTKQFASTTVGYKCQGSKLCFACGRFAVITRCAGEGAWRFREIERPRINLRSDFDVAPEVCEAPWARLAQLFPDADERTQRVLEELSQHFFETEFSTGTLIVTNELAVEDFSSYFDPRGEEARHSYLLNYIRYASKHGEVRVLHEEQGFSADSIHALQNAPGVRINMNLRLWTGQTYVQVPLGYPYLPIDQAEDAKGPISASRLRDGRFAARFARTFQHEDRQYSLLVAVDGNRRALNGYSSLDRRGKRVSGVRLTDQRGSFIASQGVKISQYNEILTHDRLQERYGALSESDAQAHYILLLDGPFGLVTNRNAISNESIAVLRSTAFAQRVRDALDQFYDTNNVFRELVQRLNSERIASQRNSQIESLNRTKKGISSRERFRFPKSEALAGKWFVSPEHGEEHWVGSLYSMLGEYVPPEHQYADYWLRPMTFAARGIDSVAQPRRVSSLAANVLKAVEYKYHFSHKDIYNHPLSITDYLVAWTLEPLPANFAEVQVRDDYECFGVVERIEGASAALAYRISGIEADAGDVYNREVVVIGLRELIDATLAPTFTTPPPG